MFVTNVTRIEMKMTRNTARFRTTVWPGVLPPVTEIDTLGPYYLDGDIIRLDLEYADIRTVAIPDELYLRELRDLDLTDPTAIIAFTNAYGRLGHLPPMHSRGYANSKRSDEPEPPPLDRHLIRLLGVDVPDERELDWDSWHTEVVTHSSIEHRGPIESGLVITDGLQHIDAFRAWAEAFHILVDIYDRYARLQAEEDEVLNLALILTELLQPFSPTIQIHHDSDLDAVFDPFEDTYPRLESILGLQMYRHLAAEDVYLRCENEPCGRLFVHQRGRAKHDQYRGIGVKYCSKNCAKAQAERERRRRNRR
jgi:hypothetical protein